MAVKEVQLQDKVYRNSLTLLLAENYTELDKYLDDVGFTGDRIDHTGLQAAYYRISPEENTEGNNNSVLWMSRKDIPCLAHELSHFIIQEFHEKHLPINLENDETFCYYLEYWMNEVIENWFDWTPRRQAAVTTAATERPNTTTEADKNAPDAQLEGSDGK